MYNLFTKIGHVTKFCLNKHPVYGVPRDVESLFDEGLNINYRCLVEKVESGHTVWNTCSRLMVSDGVVWELASGDRITVFESLSFDRRIRLVGVIMLNHSHFNRLEFCFSCS